MRPLNSFPNLDSFLDAFLSSSPCSLIVGTGSTGCNWDEIVGSTTTATGLAGVGPFNGGV